jgi:hypothetical protein
MANCRCAEPAAAAAGGDGAEVSGLGFDALN